MRHSSAHERNGGMYTSDLLRTRESKQAQTDIIQRSFSQAFANFIFVKT